MFFELLTSKCKRDIFRNNILLGWPLFCGYNLGGRGRELFLIRDKLLFLPLYWKIGNALKVK